MERDEALKLIHHHYRLLTQIKPKIDTTPPTSYYASPKSIHYVPFALRKSISLGDLKRNSKLSNGKKLNTNNKTGKDALENFVLTNNIPKTTVEYQLNSFNINARRSYLEKEAQSYSSRKKYLKDLEKILNENFSEMSEKDKYGKEIFKKGSSENQSIENNKDRQRQVEKIKIGRERYEKFKDKCLESILEKNVFSDRIIKESIYEEMDKNIGKISMKDMESVFLELCEELGIPTNGPMNVEDEKILYFSEKPPSSSSMYSTLSKSTSSSSNKKHSRHKKYSESSKSENSSISSYRNDSELSSVTSESQHTENNSKTSLTLSNSSSLSSSSSTNSFYSSISSSSSN
uniref:Uncharacterized protein n=1 Tax=Parastrongyloides trichosuri TaxID=131310 RepID=A0A0N4ZSY3_PARTI